MSYGPKRDFVNWLRVQINRPDPVGDLAREFTRLDRTAPQRGGPRTVSRYLTEHGALGAALGALARAAREWQQQL